MSKMKQDKKMKTNTDLPDKAEDRKELAEDDVTIDLPDVKDIPGQEHVRPPRPGEFADTTISSADEEGESIWKEPEINDDNSNVSPVEKELLRAGANGMPTPDEQSLKDAALDDTDNEGDPLNEKTSANAISGSDLDVPGAEEDNPDEEIGEEDEENNSYSLGGDDNSINEERSGS